MIARLRANRTPCTTDGGLAHTYQSDVETVHRLEEDEFFDLEDFSSRGDFLAKAHTYQLYFNLARPNSHKDNQSP